MIKNHFSIDFLPLNPILLGFSYTNGRVANPDADDPTYFEEYSIGFILIGFSYTRFLK